jgi:hypothetical protein
MQVAAISRSLAGSAGGLRRLSLLLLLATAASGTMFFSPPSHAARVDVGIRIGTPPPPLRVERVPPPRAGYVWVQGHWRWVHNRHVWRQGYWVRGRRGQHWVDARWRRCGPNWCYRHGHWAR